MGGSGIGFVARRVCASVKVCEVPIEGGEVFQRTDGGGTRVVCGCRRGFRKEGDERNTCG